MKAEGAGLDAIVAALRSELSLEDVELLLQSEPEFAAWKRGQPPAVAEAPVRAEVAERAGPPVDWGRYGRWTLIVLSSLASGLVGAILPGVSGAALMFAAAGPALVLILLEARRERARALRATGFVLFFGYFLPALAIFIAGVTLPHVLGAVAVLSSLPLILLVSLRAPRLRGLVDLGVASVFERDGVHFAVSYDPKPVGIGAHVLVQVLSQNVLDVPRTLHVSVRGDGVAGVEAQQHALAVEPGVVERITVPVRVPSLSQKRIEFTVDFEVTGSGIGRRLTLVRGGEWVNPTGAALTNVLGAVTLVAGGLGVFRVGSNGVVSVPIDEAQPYATEPRSLERVELYRPSQQDFAAVLGG